MPEPTDGMVAMDPSTAGADPAREATPPATDSPETPPPADAAPQEAQAPAFDSDAWLSQFRGAPEDERTRLTEALVREEPIRRVMSAENSRALAREQQRTREAQQRAESHERDLILANEDHERHFELAEQYGTKEVQAARERVGIREALQNPRVVAEAEMSAGQKIVAQMMAHEVFGALGEQDWGEALGKPDMGHAFADLVDRVANARIQAARAAIEEAAVDRYKASALPNPDLGGTRPTSPPNGGQLTPQAYRQLWTSNPAAARQLPPAEIDRLSAAMLAEAG